MFRDLGPAASVCSITDIGGKTCHLDFCSVHLPCKQRVPQWRKAFFPLTLLFKIIQWFTMDYRLTQALMNFISNVHQQFLRIDGRQARVFWIKYVFWYDSEAAGAWNACVIIKKWVFLLKSFTFYVCSQISLWAQIWIQADAGVLMSWTEVL